MKASLGNGRQIFKDKWEAYARARLSILSLDLIAMLLYDLNYSDQTYLRGVLGFWGDRKSGV